MIEIKDAQCKHQNCESCFDENDNKIKAIVIRIPESTSSRTLHLCRACRNLLVSKLNAMSLNEDFNEEINND